MNGNINNNTIIYIYGYIYMCVDGCVDGYRNDKYVCMCCVIIEW